MNENLPSPDVPLGDKANALWNDQWHGEPNFDEAHRDLAAKYPKLGSGYSRVVFDGGEVVYKIGENSANEKELAQYEDLDLANGVPVAPCRIVYHANGTSILIMETVRPVYSEDELPEWSGQVDSHQVGITRNGDVVCFDAGDSIRPMDSPYTGRVDPEFMTGHSLPSLFQDAA